MALVDFHVHIDFYDHPELIIEEYERLKIYTLFVTNLPEVYEKHLENFSHFKYVKLALGYHPELVMDYRLNEELFCKYLRRTNYVGEVGLDFTTKNDLVRQKQLESFRFVCKAISNKAKIISIHSRKAEAEVFETLKENQNKCAVFHWYTGSIKYMKDILDEGYYFSVNYKMVQTKNGQRILKQIPLDRLLFETDGPFIRKDRKKITPNLIQSIYKVFNEFYGIENFDDIVFTNFKQLLKKREKMETLVPQSITK